MSYDVMTVKFAAKEYDCNDIVAGWASSCPPSYVSKDDRPNACSGDVWAEPDSIVIGWEDQPVIY